MLIAAVFLLHFRVAGYFLPLIGISCILEIWQAFQERAFIRTALGILAVGLITVFFCLPALFPAVQRYYSVKTQEATQSSAENPEHDEYYEVKLSSFTTLGLRPWLLVTAIVSLVLVSRVETAFLSLF